MNSIRKWLYRPRRDDTSLMAQFFYADEELNLVAGELDSFDGRKDPERCTALVNQLRQAQDKVLNICIDMMEQFLPDERAPRDFRVKFPDDVMQETLSGQLWFGAEILGLLNKQKKKEELILRKNEVLFSDEDEEPTNVPDEESVDPLQIPCDGSDVSYTSSTSQYNTLQLRNVALQGIRYGVGLHTTAAYLDAGLITAGCRRLVDHNKVKRTREIMKSLDEEFQAQCWIGKIGCIISDGRQDSTKVLLQADNLSHQFPSILKEEH